MKKFFLTSLIIMILFSLKPFKVYAANGDYAQIKNSTTYLYKSVEENDNISNIYCLLEESYFVKILFAFNDFYYKVEYNGLTGYVKKSGVTVVNETPVNPYPVNITLNTSSSTYLRSTPKIKDVVNNTILQIKEQTQNIEYLGRTLGEEAIDFGGNVWYLVKYNQEIGYIYSGYVSYLSLIPRNVEVISVKNINNFQTVNPLTNTESIIIIFIITLPTVLILIMLTRPRKKLKTAKSKQDYKEIKIKYYDDENL